MQSQDPIRLTPTSYAVLGLVRFMRRATPYDLKRGMAESIENFWPVPHTTFYAEPERLAAAGYLSEHREAEGRRRKTYEITDRGSEALRDWVSSPEANPPQLRDEGTLKVFLGGDPAAIYGHRLEWHQGKLAELEGYLRNVEAEMEAGDRDPEELEGVRAALIAGTGYHRMNVELIESAFDSDQLSASTRPTISSA